jgi:hypothetical protein
VALAVHHILVAADKEFIIPTELLVEHMAALVAVVAKVLAVQVLLVL